MEWQCRIVNECSGAECKRPEGKAKEWQENSFWGIRMATRIIKDSIWTSPNLNKLSALAERHFYRLLPLPDDHGCCQVTPAVVKGVCYPLKDDVTIENVQKWNKELEELDLIRTWEENGRVYAYFPTWSKYQRVRSLNKRKTPEPPPSVVNCRQVTADDRSFPLFLPPVPSSSPLPPSPKNTCRASSTISLKDQAKEIFDYWKKERNRNLCKLDDKREKAIIARLREGYTIDRIKQAIRGINFSPHHMGKNDAGTIYDDIELICREGAKLDNFADLEENNGANNKNKLRSDWDRRTEGLRKLVTKNNSEQTDLRERDGDIISPLPET